VNPGSYCVVNENKNNIYPPELQPFFSSQPMPQRPHAFILFRASRKFLAAAGVLSA
jgi:hypothetical protein